MAYIIDLRACINCGLCRKGCPTDCISYFGTGHRTHVIHAEGCIDCDICAQLCPVDCITIDNAYEPDLVLFEAAKGKAKEWARKRRQEQLAAREAAAAVLARLHSS